MLIDDEPQAVRDMKLLLEAVGNYSVEAFESAVAALAFLRGKPEGLPALIICDITMPEMDGYAFGTALRADYILSRIPLLYLTARTAVKDKIDVRKITPHYFPKDGDRRELLAMISSILEDNLVHSGVNPLTQLPGNVIIEKEVNSIVTTKHAYMILYMDFDNFKAYNDLYGTHAGDKAIQEGAIAINRALRQSAQDGYFLGHIGGDDFVAVVWDSTDVEPLCATIFAEIDKIRVLLYSETDLRRGYLEAKNRAGNLERFGLLSISIGVIASNTSPVSTWAEASTRLVSVKKRAKSVTGNSFWVDRRKE
jgi:diguanylate cyclase (GGDEF)-like protein